MSEVLEEEAAQVVSVGFIAPSIGELEDALYFTTLPSTTEKAKQVLDQGRLRVPGAVVIWDETIGRRTGSKAVPKGWWANNGSLTVTFVFPRQAGLSPESKIERAATAMIRVAASFQPKLP